MNIRSRGIFGDIRSGAGLYRGLPADVLSRSGSPYQTWFEDFDSTPIADGELAGSGAVVTDINSATSPTEVADPATGYLLINPGSKADAGTEVQFTGAVSQTTAVSPLVKTPGTITSTATLMDNRELIWAARVGFQSGATTWDGKAIFGWITTDTSLLTSGTGVPSVAAGGGAGFHIAEAGTFTVFSTNAAVTAAGTSINTPDFSSGLSAATTLEWHEFGLRIRWTDASAGSGSTMFYIDGAHVATITDTQPMDSTEGYNTTFGIVNGPSQVSDMAVDWVMTAISRPGITYPYSAYYPYSGFRL